MATDQKKIREDVQHWCEAMNAHDLDRMYTLADEIYAPDWVVHDPTSPDFGRGPAGVKQFARQVLTDWPDIHMTIEDMFGEGDRLAVRIMCNGTRASTGKKAHFPVMWMSRYVDNKDTEEWELVGPPDAAP